MNIRKNIDYSDMYNSLDKTMSVEMPQMEQCYEIGKTVCRRSEKGAAVAAAEYLSKKYPDSKGFSPRNLRRMRDFYRAYEDTPSLLDAAMQVGWTQNVVILEADLSNEQREWYLRAAKQFGWSKAELIEKIKDNAYEAFVLRCNEKECSASEEAADQTNTYRSYAMEKKLWLMIQRIAGWAARNDEGRRRCMMLPVYGPVHMRC